MFVLALFALFIAIAYFFVPGVREGAEPLHRFMDKHGLSAAFLSMIVFAGVIPWLFFLVDRSIRPEYPGWTGVIQALWRACLGVLCTMWFHVQDMLFGSGTDILTLAVKTAVDQFLWTPIVLAPLDATFYFWIGRDFSFARVRADWPASFVRGVLLPNLIMGWCISIPMNMVVYAFPVAMRIVVCGLFGSFWSLVCLQIGKRSSAHA